MSVPTERIEALFEALVALETAAQRAEYLKQACPDPQLRREVESLLAAHLSPDTIFAEKTPLVRGNDAISSNSHDPYVGQTLDEKYRLERLLGHGGMSAVYLATHLGTERYVAVKLMTPQLMCNDESVERFKREARAAGRLRHPNIVDVTDFGFARMGGQSVAYLVMEYLDGCTLGDVLTEQKRLPLPLAVDILEQVCSAVHEAHQQGVVHRDLKPDNIWLEPNRLGGYRAKVLDFGIAKLTETGDVPPRVPSIEVKADEKHALSVMPPTNTATARKSEWGITSPEGDPPDNPETKPIPKPSPAIMEVAQVQPLEIEKAPAGQLTGIGAILGTPLFMSPEQCRGQGLDARSDIYNLGVVAYQMLSGQPPFTGDAISVMRSHRESLPKPLHEYDRKLSKRISCLIMSALEKDPAARPPTALAFANELRASADGLGALYRRALALYSEYFPEIFKLSLLAHIPVIAALAMTIGMRLGEPRLAQPGNIGLEITFGLLNGAMGFVTASTISGLTSIIVTQLTVVPLKVVDLKQAFVVVRRRWRPFIETGILATLRIFFGFILLVVPGVVMTVRYSLWAPVVLLEGVAKRPALERSRALASRSWCAMIIVLLVQFIVPKLVAKLFGILIGVDTVAKRSVPMKGVSELASSILLLPLFSIVPALLYLKMRQYGGENLNELNVVIESDSTPGNWEQRLRGRLTGRPL